MFRPYRSKVSSVYNDIVIDRGESDSFGVEVGLGNLVHGSTDFKSAPSISYTGGWFNNNNVLNYFNEKDTDAKSVFYEPITLKMVGGLVVDSDTNYNNKIHGTEPLRIDIGGNKKNTFTSAYNLGGNRFYGNSEIKRNSRFLRNQVVEKITDKEASRDRFITRNENAAPHHTAGIKILKTDGSTYVYGNTVYSTKKVEATFDVSGPSYIGNNTSGLVNYKSPSLYGHGSAVSDEYVNKITTPAYAHSYLLSSILSNDYEDIDNNGPTINDLGSFTKFEYNKTDSKYSWRVPFEKNIATYNEGLISKDDDQKGNYLYGEKELKYLNRIVTKTHIAFFDTEDRKDAIGVEGEHGGAGNGRMKKLTAIRLYSRPEVTNSDGTFFDPMTLANSSIKPIKTAHFVYNYSLCKGIPSFDSAAALTPNETSKVGNGKLTLDKVYFTYGNSNMGRYTPYVFNYEKIIDIQTGQTDPNYNPNYNIKGFDIWGNYKFNTVGSGYINTALSTTEFPFVEQNRAVADINTAAWTLKSIKLPSGGTITIETESDDYQYVQNKKAMQMFKVVGVGRSKNIPEIVPSNNNELYNGGDHTRFLYVKLSDLDITTGPNAINNRNIFLNKYLKNNLDKPINFRFLVNMTDNASKYDYVSGYLKIANDLEIEVNYRSNFGGTIVSIPVQFISRDDSSRSVNPIAKAGWGLGRTYMNRLVYGINDNPSDEDFSSIVENLVGSIGSILEIFRGPNGQLQSKGCARIFKPEKSWIRLENPDGHKLGGGLRVKKIKLSDNWTKMLEPTGTQFDMEYGQEYSYNQNDDVDSPSSGVATFEPNMCAENPFIVPFYNGQGNYAESIAAPVENNYTEKPFGVNFFPAPTVTYSRVKVKNLDRTTDGVTKHATGSVVTQHYTTFDFPTKVRNTDLKMINGITPTNVIADMLQNIILGGNIDVRNLLTLTQGFSVETNDMNGKVRFEKVYNESGNEMSSIEYKYNTDGNNEIDNNITTIDEKGNVGKKIIGVDYDVINDFNQSYSQTNTSGFKANLAGFLIPIGIIPLPIFIPTVFPESSTNVNEMRTAVTTKHVHKTAILVEKIATDLGSTVSTKNIAWDAKTGEVLLTKTQNEYSDSYFSLNYPAYWAYDGMGLASQNLGISGTLEATTAGLATPASANASNDPYFNIKGYTGSINKVFHVGDELNIPLANGVPLGYENPAFPGATLTANRVWVVGIKDNNKILLMDKSGNYINKCNNLSTFPFKIVRSGFRNQQVATMASITSMINPIDINGDGVYNMVTANSFKYNGTTDPNPRIINSSAVKYNDFWLPQVESNSPYYPEYNPLLVTSTFDSNKIFPNGDVKYPYNILVNPYLWNIKGDYRPEKSYAYLTGRNTNAGVVNNPRNEGFFNDFEPFYQFLNNNCVVVPIIPNKWTYASSVTKISPYGAELENKDALNRSSAAQYGYQYKLPMAVASNSTYQQMGFEGFEELKTGVPDKHFGFYLNSNSITSDQSHTGRNSIKIAKGSRSLIWKNLKPSPKEILRAKCPEYTGTVGWDNWNFNFSCAGAPVLGGFFGDSNTFYPPFTICLGEFIGGCCNPYHFSNVSYCLENANNGGSATLTGGGIKINPANGNQIMYVTMTLTVPGYTNWIGSWPSSSTNYYLKVIYEADGTWTYESVPNSSLFNCPPPPCADCTPTTYNGPITIAAYTDCSGAYHGDLTLGGVVGGVDNPYQTIYTCGPHNNGGSGDGGDGGDGGAGGHEECYQVCNNGDYNSTGGNYWDPMGLSCGYLEYGQCCTVCIWVSDPQPKPSPKTGKNPTKKFNKRIK